MHHNLLLPLPCLQVHIWTLTPREMILTAHVTYQNKEVYREIHTQVTPSYMFLSHIICHIVE